LHNYLPNRHHHLLWWLAGGAFSGKKILQNDISLHLADGRKKAKSGAVIELVAEEPRY